MTTVVLAVSGSIAAYKAVEVARLLIKRGLRVIPVLTASGARFVGPALLAGICGETCHDTMWNGHGELHVELAAEADVVALVPATADLLAALAQGRANTLVRALALCARGPLLAAPAMHPNMWHHPATQRNIAQLAEDNRVQFVGPTAGLVASGDEGMGRLAEPGDIAAAIVAAAAPGDLAGRHVVVSAGPTVEDIDPARYVSNRSSGRMGFAVAERAAARGARVTLVAGPVHLETPAGVDRIDVRGARQMQTALDDALGPQQDQAHAVVMAAAVADYRPVDVRGEKLKRKAETLTLTFEKNPDLIATIGAKRTGHSPYLVGFALETAGDDEGLTALARGKLARKRVDLVVANRPDAFDGEHNRVLLVTADEVETLPTQRKTSIADHILDRVAQALETHGV